MILRRIAPVVLAAVLLGACGSSDDTADTASAESEDLETDEGAADEPADDAEAAEPESNDATDGSGTATLTVSDGTVYEFEMSSCETSNNTDIFLVDPGYDLFGRDDDDFRIQLIRAIPDGNALGTLEGGFDENGVNPAVTYVFREPDSILTLDGNTLTGDLQLSGSISAEKIHGDDATASLVVSC